MRRILILWAFGLIGNALMAQKATNPKLYVYYFHITQRCATCINIETTTKRVLEQYFRSQMDKGIIKFKAINVDLSENKAISEKYQVYGSSLLLVKMNNGKEQIEDMTNFAFGKIHHEAVFTQGLKEKIKQLLK